MNPAVHPDAVAGHRRFRILMWIFCLSFAFDFRGEKGGSTFQLVFLAIALVAGTLALMTSLRFLRVRPGIYLIVLWWVYLASTVAMAVFGEVEPGRYLRVAVPYLLCGLGLVVAHIAAVRGIRVQEIVLAVAIAASVNVAWRIAYGFAFSGASIDDVRLEILGPGINWLMAFIGCGILLRDKISPLLIFPIGLCACTMLLSVTRSTLFPPTVSAVATAFCLMLAVFWGIVPVRWMAGRVFRISICGVFAVATLTIFLLLQGTILERWEERLFHQAVDVTSRDVSWLSREAEAVGIWKSLMSEPPTVIYGKGMGASYFWDPSYFPEIYVVYGEEGDFDDEIWFAGHSIWTFTLFSGGILGVLCIVGFFAGVMWLSLRSVYRNAIAPGFRVDLAFLPFVATCCLLSATLTSNPFDERLAGLLFGVMAGLPQFFFNRAHALRNPGRPVTAGPPPRAPSPAPRARPGAIAGHSRP